MHAKSHWSRNVNICIVDLIFVRFEFHGKCNSSIAWMSKESNESTESVGTWLGRGEVSLLALRTDKMKIYGIWDAEWLMNDLSALLYTCFPTLCMRPCQNICCLLRSPIQMCICSTLWLWPSESVFYLFYFFPIASHSELRTLHSHADRYMCDTHSYVHTHGHTMRVGTEIDIGRKASNQIHLINLNSLWHHVPAEHRFFSAYACVP